MGSTARPAQPQKSSMRDFYIWAFAGSPIKIHLGLEIVAKLRQCLLVIAKGTEAAGVLLGRVEANRVYITAFRQFETDTHKTEDPERLKQLLRRTNSGPEGEVVGYFRGTQDGEIRLSTRDLDLIHEHFSSATDVFLVMRQEKDGNATAGFFFWDSGSIFGDASFMKFPLDERLLAASTTLSVIPKEVSKNPPVRAEEVSLQAFVQNVEEPAATNGPIFKNVFSRSAWILSGFAIAALIGYFLLRPEPSVQNNPGPRAVISSPMYLSASRIDKSIAISWDAQLPAIAQARIGVLTIKDRETQTEYALTKAQLLISKLIYNSQSDRLEITLEVFSPEGKSTRESVLFVAQDEASRYRKAPDARLRNSESAPAILVSTLPKKETAALAPVHDPTATRDQTTRLTSETGKEARLYTASPLPKAPLPEHNLITDTPPPAQTAALDPAVMKIPDFLRTSPPEAAAPRRTPDVTSTLLPIQPATAIRQVRPTVPSNVSVLLKHRVEVKVRVTVDTNGNVTGAEPMVPPGGVNQYLATAAANAARQWTFKPASRGAVALPSEVVLQFTFGPGQ